MNCHQSIVAKKQRRPNFDHVELCKLVDGVEKFHSSLFGKFSASLTNLRKQELWEDITLSVNSIKGLSRTADECMNKWVHIKSDAKKREKDRIRYRNGTGGGPPPRQPTELDLRILSMIPQESLSGIMGAVEVSGPNHLVVVADVHHEDTHDVVNKIPGPILNDTIIEKSNSPPATPATPAKRKRPSSTSSDPYITILEQQLLVDKERNEIMKDDLKVRKEILSVQKDILSELQRKTSDDIFNTLINEH